MTEERYVVLGLADTRSPWFGDVARWSTRGSLPVEFVKCVSVEEVRARLTSGRPYSALLASGRATTLDRDLTAQAAAVGCPVLVIGPAAADPAALGAAAELPARLDEATLLSALREHARPVATPTARRLGTSPPTPVGGHPGRLVAVTGGGGTGASVTAMAVAQHLGTEAGHDQVVLVDAALRADQAVLHDTGDVLPGIQELTERCRLRQLGRDDLFAHTFAGPHHAYRVVLGLRRHRDWTALRPAALRAALAAIRGAFEVVVADVDADVEGEPEVGSVDVEDRNLLSRSVLGAADVVVVTARADLAGLHRFARIANELTGFGIDTTRLVPVLVGVGRSPIVRAELTRTVALLLEPLGAPAAPPVFVARHRGVEARLRDGLPVPGAVAHPVGAAVGHRLTQLVPRPEPQEEPAPITPGTLGSWSEESA